MATFLPLPQAAARLGISPSSLRRRVRSGAVQAERRPASGGFAWWVAYEEPAPPPGEPAPTQAVTLLQAHVDDLRRQLEDRTREVQELHVTINRLLLALPAPAPIAPMGETPPQTQSAPPADGQAGRSWWRRWWAWWVSGAAAPPAGA